MRNHPTDTTFTDHKLPHLLHALTIQRGENLIPRCTVESKDEGYIVADGWLHPEHPEAKNLQANIDRVYHAINYKKTMSIEKLRELVRDEIILDLHWILDGEDNANEGITSTFWKVYQQVIDQGRIKTKKEDDQEIQEIIDNGEILDDEERKVQDEWRAQEGRRRKGIELPEDLPWEHADQFDPIFQKRPKTPPLATLQLTRAEQQLFTTDEQAKVDPESLLRSDALLHTINSKAQETSQRRQLDVLTGEYVDKGFDNDSASEYIAKRKRSAEEQKSKRNSGSVVSISNSKRSGVSSSNAKNRSTTSLSTVSSASAFVRSSPSGSRHT